VGQVVQNVFLKAANVISQARQDEAKDAGAKINKWFNLNTYDIPREDLKPWKTTLSSSIPPLVVETFLDLRALTPKQALVLKDDQGASWNINTKKSEIVMERWLIELDAGNMDTGDVDLPLLYKKLIVTFRFLYVVARLLPSYKLMKRLNKVKLTKVPLKIGTRILDGNRPIVSKGRIGLSKSIVNSESHLIQKVVKPVITSVGVVKISVSYRRHYNFQLNDNEETLSNHFIHIDRSKNTSTSLLRAFKAGQASPPPSSSPLTRNESGASITHALKIQRSGSVGTQNNSVPKSVTSSVGSMGIPFHNNQEIVSSSGSTPKYSSSFGNIARRSSIRRSSSVDKGVPSSYEKPFSPDTKQSPEDEDNINDFVKMLDNKSDLQLHYSPNVHDSLGKFQMMRGRNDILSESMSASFYSKSHSPPPVGTPSNSLWRNKLPSGSPRSNYNYSVPLMPSKLSETNSSNESLLLNDNKSVPVSRAGSLSPGSIFKRTNKSITVGPSNPTIAASQTHAKMHRTHATSIDSVADRTEEDEDDELLFTMSDMNLTK
jgi:autophagy-related protein 13